MSYMRSKFQVFSTPYADSEFWKKRCEMETTHYAKNYKHTLRDFTKTF